VSNSATKVVPSVDGASFWVYDMAFDLGTQAVVAAIRDAAGNTAFVTNTVFLSVVTNGAYLFSPAGCVTSISYSGTEYSRNIGLTWNGQYQLTALTTNGAPAEQNAFDPLGRRVSCGSRTVSGALETNYFVWSGDDLVAEVNSTGGLRRSYVYAGLDMPLAMVVHTGATAKTYFYLTDRQGTVHAIADETGAVVESYRFDAWGRILGVYNGSGTPLTESAIGNRILWQGREYSWSTGLYYFRARWYDPITGRWLSNDPIGISGGLNQYVFCANNPVNFTDPSGLCTEGNDGPGFWDWAQGVLDAGGVVEPTPFCDLTSAIISGFRGNFGDAGWSLLGMVPYVGDLGKVGKYGGKAAKYADKLKDIDNAVDNLQTIQDAQKMIRQGKLEGKIIDSTQKSEDAVKNMLRQIKHPSDVQ
jgi:RHS repeat-associated protein